ncbi:MAG: YfgM family protein [Aeromonas sp.]
MEIYETEEQQVEQIKAWIKENGSSVIIGTVLGLAGLFGWRFYTAQQLSGQEGASQGYDQVTNALQTGEQQALDAARNFASDQQGASYGQLAALQLAAAAIKADKLDLAAEQLRNVVKQADAELLPIALLRLARVELALGNTDDALVSVSQIKATGFAAQASELRGDILVAQKKMDDARAAYQKAADAGGLDESPALKLKMDDLAMAVPVVPAVGAANE